MDVGENTTLGDGHAGEELAQLLIVAHSQLDVAGDDSGLLVVASGVAGKLQHLGCQVLKHGSQVDWGTGANALGVAALLQVAGDTAHWELQAGLGGLAHGLLAGGFSFSASRHC